MANAKLQTQFKPSSIIPTKKDTKSKRGQPSALLWSVYVFVFLFVLWFVLSGLLKKQNARYQKMSSSLNFEGLLLDDNTLTNMRRLAESKISELGGMLEAFDAQAEWGKKDYNLSIYFVEELKNIHTTLELKAKDKALDFKGLGFKEELPSDQDAMYLLKQLYTVEKVASAGLESGLKFEEVKPQVLPKKAKTEQFRTLTAKLVFSAQPQELVEFLSKVSSLKPLVLIESISVVKSETYLKVGVGIKQLAIDDELRPLRRVEPLDLAMEAKEEQGFINALRGANPFSVTAAKKVKEPKDTKVLEAPTPPAQRFFYRGKVKSGSGERVAIEDSTSGETLFMEIGDKISGYILTDIKTDSVVLREVKGGNKITVSVNVGEE